MESARIAQMLHYLKWDTDPDLLEEQRTIAEEFGVSFAYHIESMFKSWRYAELHGVIVEAEDIDESEQAEIYSIIDNPQDD